MSEVQQNGGTSKRELPQQTAVSHGAGKIPIVHQRNVRTNGAGTEMRDPAEGDCGFALLPPPEVSIPAEFVPFLSERCAYAPYSFAGVFGVLHFFTPGVCLLSGLSVREARSRSVLSAKAARSRAALDDTAAPLSFRFPLSESVHRFRGRCFLAGSSHFL